MDGLGALLAPFNEPELASGMRAAAVPVLVTAVAGLVLRRRTDAGPVPVGGLAFAGAALLAYGAGRAVPGEVTVGVLLCALGGLALDVWSVSPVLAGCALVPGALVVAGSATVDTPGDRGFPSLVIFAGIVGGGALVGSFDQRWRRLSPALPLLALTAGGIYATVPDTELALATLGAAITVAVLGWPLRLARIGGAGAGAAVATVAWAVAVDGATRDGAVVGALGCLGLLVVDPVVRMLGERSPLRHFGPTARVGVLGFAHVVVVLWMSRVAGLQRGWPVAGALAGLGLFGAAVAWAAGGRLRVLPFASGTRQYSPPR